VSFGLILYYRFLVPYFGDMASSDTRYEGTGSLASDTPSKPCRSSVNASRKSISETPVPAALPHGNPAADMNGSREAFDNVNIGVANSSPANTPINTPWNTVENIAAIGLSFNVDDSPQKYSSPTERFSLDDYEPKTLVSSHQLPHHRFHKWITNLQRRAVQRRKTVSGGQEYLDPEPDLLYSDKEHGTSRHKKSLSGSSLGFVTAVKSASISLASFGVTPCSRRTARSSRYQRTKHGSKASNAGVRFSEDSSCLAKGVVIDEAVKARSIQRRQVLEEIIRTEEGYVADIRFLMNVCN
jgi:hypothetical protein